MDKPEMYLKKRKGWFIFRRPIPKALQAFIGKGCRTEFIFSLKTKDRREISRPYVQALRESERIIEEAASKQKAANGRVPKAHEGSTKRPERLALRAHYHFSKDELTVLVHRWYLKAKVEALEESRFLFNECGREERQDKLSKLKGVLASLERQEGAGNDLETPRQVRRLIEDAGGFVAWPQPATFIWTESWFTSSVREVLISLNHYSQSILETGVPPRIETIPHEFAGVSISGGVTDSPSISLDELMDRFEKDPSREEVKAKTRDEFKLVFRMLREAIGGETPIASITRTRIKELQDLYRQLPARFTALYPHKNMREVLELARRDGKTPMKRATFNKRMTLLSSVFRYAEREQLIQSSPAQGLTMKKDGKGNDAKSFSVEQLNLIFSGPLYQAFMREPESRFTPKHPLNPHEFWMPLIALFQGCRMEEALQLHEDDIIEVQGVLCIRITDGEGQSLKTKASKRTVPMHPVLVKSGFGRYVIAIRSAGSRDIFPEAKRGKTYDKLSHNYSKRFGYYLKKIGVWKLRTHVFHSFRHTFDDAFRMAGVQEDIRCRIGGWSGAKRSVESTYGGSDMIIPFLANELAKLKYEGLDLSHLMPPPLPRKRLRKV